MPKQHWYDDTVEGFHELSPLGKALLPLGFVLVVGGTVGWIILPVIVIVASLIGRLI